MISLNPENSSKCLIGMFSTETNSLGWTQLGVAYCDTFSFVGAHLRWTIPFQEVFLDVQRINDYKGVLGSNKKEVYVIGIAVNLSSTNQNTRKALAEALADTSNVSFLSNHQNFNIFQYIVVYKIDVDAYNDPINQSELSFYLSSSSTSFYSPRKL